MVASSGWTPRVRRVVANSEQERLTYAGSLLRERKFEEAGEAFEQVLEQNDRSLGALLGLGITHLASRKPAEALTYLTKAMEVDPLTPQAPLQAGVAALALGELEQAQAYFSNALQLEPSQSGAHLGLAQVLQKKNELEPAIEHARAALRFDPAMNAARMLMAQLQKRSGNVTVAIEELQSLLRAHPGQPAASVLLASMYSENNQDEQALELLEASTKLRPDQASVWSLQGRLRMKMKDYAGAEASFRKASELRTKDTFGPLRIVEAMVPQGKLDEAMEMLEDVPRRGPAAALVFKFYGDIYAARKNYDEAVASYRAAMLNSKDGGDAVVAALEAELGDAANSELTVGKYQEAIKKLEEQGRERVLQRDFQSTVRQLNPGSWQQREGGRGRPGRGRAGAPSVG